MGYRFLGCPVSFYNGFNISLLIEQPSLLLYNNGNFDPGSYIYIYTYIYIRSRTITPQSQNPMPEDPGACSAPLSTLDTSRFHFIGKVLKLRGLGVITPKTPIGFGGVWFRGLGD